MENLTQEQAYAACERMISGSQSDAEIAQTLVSLAEKGETAEEIIGFTRSTLAHALTIPFDGDTVDLCGTGGSAFPRFNVSTAAAFIAACFGGKVAKHGNRGSRRPNGSFDFLEALDIPIDLDGEALSDCLDKTNLAFIFARNFHPAMKAVANARKIADRRTIFNLAGPLSNPTKVRHQVIGTADKSLMYTLLDAARNLGRKKTIVVHGAPGIDELSMSGSSSLLYSYSWEQKLGYQNWSPSNIGLNTVAFDAIPSGDAASNAALFLDLIEGKAPESIEDMVAINAGLVLNCMNSDFTIKKGYRSAKEIIRSGAMKNKFHQYKELAKKHA